MGSLGAVECVCRGVGFRFLGAGVGVRVGNFGGFAFDAGDDAVDEGQNGGCDEGEGEDVAGSWSAREARKVRRRTHSSWGR